MKALTVDLSKVVQPLFQKLGCDPSLGKVEISNRPDLAHFQCNGALPAAKALGKKPREIADALTLELKKALPTWEIGIAGPGFINFKAPLEVLKSNVQNAATGNLTLEGLGNSQKFIFDYGGPNVAKSMHVGHLRSCIIGDSLVKIFRFLGHRVWGDIHLGDWGTPMGMLISEIEKRNPGLPYFDPRHQGPYPSEAPVTMDDLCQLYPLVSKECEKDPLRRQIALQATARLQSGDPGYLALWNHFIDLTRKDVEANLAGLGVVFDLWRGESFYAKMMDQLVTNLKSQGIAIESEGAWIIPVKATEAPLLLVKSDGSYLYSTSDLATIKNRTDEFDPDYILYVVDSRQSAHFKQVFEASELAGFSKRAHLEHIRFGTVNGTDGKPLKTRSGGNFTLQGLIELVISKAHERVAMSDLSKESSKEELTRTAEAIGIAALKFADLKNHRESDYIFDVEAFTQFEGRTGPYLLYTGVRIKSIFRKLGHSPSFKDLTIHTDQSEAEKALLLEINLFPEYLMKASEWRAPHFLCEYAFNLAQRFNHFYKECPILPEKDLRIQESRLLLSHATLEVMSKTLHLLGIEIPNWM